MRSFVEFLKPVRERLRQLSGHPQPLTMVFDAGGLGPKGATEEVDWEALSQTISINLLQNTLL